MSGDDVRKQFDDLISGADMDDLRRASWQLLAVDALSRTMTRPNLRRRRLREVLTYRIRVELNGSDPAIWRTVEVRSDLTLDVVHSVVQGAFGWTDTHLYRFACGGGPFDEKSQLYLCPFDVEVNEEEGVPTDRVRLDEVLRDVGDEIAYAYDFGDGWELTLRLEQVREYPNGPSAVCVDGWRAAPPEDSAGITRGEDLARVLEDPETFDVDEANHWLIDPFLVLSKAEVNPALMDLLARLLGSPVADTAISHALRLEDPWPSWPPDEMLAVLSPIQWFLDRAYDGGIPLTSAGYLTAEEVQAASAVIPMYWRQGIGEVEVPELLSFRRALQSTGLLRRRKDRLHLTKAGQMGRIQSEKIWGQVASRLIPKKVGFEQDAALVALLFTAVSPERELPAELMGEVMAALGWQKDGRLIDYDALRWATPAMVILHTLSDPFTDGPLIVGRVAASLAREALFW